jgi:hypothetical protein
VDSLSPPSPSCVAIRFFYLFQVHNPARSYGADKLRVLGLLEDFSKKTAGIAPKSLLSCSLKFSFIIFARAADRNFLL